MTLKLSGNGRFLAANIQNHFIITYEIVPLPFDIARLVGFTLRIEVVVVSGVLSCYQRSQRLSTALDGPQLLSTALSSTGDTSLPVFGAGYGFEMDVYLSVIWISPS